MKLINKLEEIIQFVLSIVTVFTRRARRKHNKHITKEVDELEKKYKEALAAGDPASMVYYRKLIDLRLRDAKL